MTKISYLFCLISFVTISFSKLYQVVLVTSPGARYHINDLYDGKQTQKWWGQITSVGLRQHQSLGKILKKQYTQKLPFLNTVFNHQQFQLLSKKSNRTIQSSLSNFYGLFPLGNGQKLTNASQKYHLPPYSNKTDLDEPVYSLPKGQLVFPIKFDGSFIEICQNQANQIQKNIKQQLVDYNQMNITYTPFIKKMANIFKIDQNTMNFSKLSMLFDTINVDKFLGKKIPQSLTNDDMTNLEHLYHWYSHFVYNFNLSKAYNTHTFAKILSIFQARTKNIENTTLKWTSLSLQEKDITSLRNDLNISSAKCIEQKYRAGSTSALNCQKGTIFASNIIFELHSDNSKDFYIKLRNNGKYIKLCQNQNTQCDYTNWKTRIQKYILPNPNQICDIPQTTNISVE